MAADTLRERIAQALRGKSRERSDGEWLQVDDATDAALPVVEQALTEEREKLINELRPLTHESMMDNRTYVTRGELAAKLDAFGGHR